jgi:hypoxanthine phosphoribosyltransferase
MILNYINYNTLIADTYKLARQLSNKYDAIVGIPRSGLIPASVIGFYFNRPVMTPTELTNGFYSSGHRTNKNPIKKVLLIDDSITSGSTIKENLALIKDIEVDTAVIYTDRPNVNVNYFVRQIHAPRVFQWNVLNHGHLKHACIDFDGVLCKDPTFIETDNNMNDHILNAEPLHIPKLPLYAIITNRIERYRPECIEWLKRYDIKYTHLIMYPGTANERRKHFLELGGNGIWKAQKCKEIFGSWFIESNIVQATQIRKIIGCSVFCTEKTVIQQVQKLDN